MDIGLDKQTTQTMALDAKQCQATNKCCWWSIIILILVEAITITLVFFWYFNYGPGKGYRLAIVKKGAGGAKGGSGGILGTLFPCVSRSNSNQGNEMSPPQSDKAKANAINMRSKVSDFAGAQSDLPSCRVGSASYSTATMPPPMLILDTESTMPTAPTITDPSTNGSDSESRRKKQQALQRQASKMKTTTTTTTTTKRQNSKLEKEEKNKGILQPAAATITTDTTLQTSITTTQGSKTKITDKGKRLATTPEGSGNIVPPGGGGGGGKLFQTLGTTQKKSATSLKQVDKIDKSSNNNVVRAARSKSALRSNRNTSAMPIKMLSAGYVPSGHVDVRALGGGGVGGRIISPVDRFSNSPAEPLEPSH